MGGKPRLPAGPTLTIAVPKGRILDQLGPLLRRAGFAIDDTLGGGRKLIYERPGVKLLLIRGGDVPAYVHHGAADMGITGLDSLLEADLDLYQPLDLKLAQCKLVLAHRENRPIDPAEQIRIATKYPLLTKRYLASIGAQAEIIKLSGSVELGPLVGLSDYVVDITETGSTLRENGLQVVDEILHISSRLVVNRPSFHLHFDRINAVVANLRREVEQ